MGATNMEKFNRLWDRHVVWIIPALMFAPWIYGAVVLYLRGQL